MGFKWRFKAVSSHSLGWVGTTMHGVSEAPPWVEGRSFREVCPSGDPPARTFHAVRGAAPRPEQRRAWSHLERRASRANLGFRARPQHPQQVFIKPLFLQCFPGEVCITPRPSWTMKPAVQKHAGVITAIPDPQPGGWYLPFSTAGGDERRGSPAGQLSWDETATPSTAPASLSPASGVSLFFIILGCHRGAWYPGRH